MSWFRAGRLPHLPRQLECASVVGLKNTVIKFLIFRVGDPPLWSMASSYCFWIKYTP